MGGCPGICRDPSPGPANPRGWDRDKNLQDSPVAKIPRDNKSQNFGTRIPPSPGTVPLFRDSTGPGQIFVECRGALVSPHSRFTEHAELETLSVVAPRASVLNRLSLVKA